MKSKHCSLCFHNNFYVKYRLPHFDVIQCRHCGLLLRDKKLSLKEIKDLYSKKYFTKEQKKYFSACFNKKDLKFKTNDRIKEFIGHLETIDNLVSHTKKKLFDIGCATGTFLELAKEKNYQVAGIDVSNYAVKYARKNHLKVTLNRIENYKANGQKFSVVTAWDVLPNIEDLPTAMIKIKKMLKAKGVFAAQLTVTDALIFYLSHFIYILSFGRLYHFIAAGYPINHAQHFTRKTLNQLLKQNGFKILKFENIEFNFKYSYFPKIFLPIFKMVGAISKLMGKTTQYRVFAQLK